jgi:hypothetical protein
MADVGESVWIGERGDGMVGSSSHCVERSAPKQFNGHGWLTSLAAGAVIDTTTRHSSTVSRPLIPLIQ